MKVMFKQMFNNIGYCWVGSDIIKNSFFLFEGKRIHHIMNMQQIVCFLFLLGSTHFCFVPKKIGKCDGGIRSGLWALVRLDGRWFGQDRFWLTKEAINFNAMHILNFFRIRSLLFNFLYTMKELTRETSNRSKSKQG